MRETSDRIRSPLIWQIRAEGAAGRGVWAAVAAPSRPLPLSVHARFSEGFETTDLRAVRRMLDG